MTLLERANAISNPVTRCEMVALVHECHAAMLEAIEIPNELLADEYQNKASTNEDTQREAFQPLSVLIERLEREELAANPPMSEHEKLKAITTERADRYASSSQLANRLSTTWTKIACTEISWCSPTQSVSVSKSRTNLMQSKLWQIVQWDINDGSVIPVVDMLSAFPSLYRNDVVSTYPAYLATVVTRLNETSLSNITFFVVQCEDLSVAV